MNNVALTFRRAGLYTTVQEASPTGYRQYGVPFGGPMDKTAAETANRLVGNAPEAPVLEITVVGPEIAIEGDCQLAVTGADLSPVLNGVKMPMYETIFVKSGSALTFGGLQSGCRAYLAVGGEWESLYGRENGLPAGFFPASVLKKQDVLRVKTRAFISPQKHLKPDFSNSIVVKTMPGPEFDLFPEAAVRYFFGRTHRISKDANRMGYRLDTQLPGFSPEGELISSGVIPGTIQVTASGQPVVLLADAQTTGGYYRLGNVMMEELDRLAQLKPGDTIRFLLFAPNFP